MTDAMYMTVCTYAIDYVPNNVYIDSTPLYVHANMHITPSIFYIHDIGYTKIIAAYTPSRTFAR